MKYDIGQRLSVMRSNKPAAVRVYGRQLTELHGQEPTVCYQCKYEADGLVHWHWEHELFATEEELKASL